MKYFISYVLSIGCYNNIIRISLSAVIECNIINIFNNTKYRSDTIIAIISPDRCCSDNILPILIIRMTTILILSVSTNAPFSSIDKNSIKNRVVRVDYRKQIHLHNTCDPNFNTCSVACQRNINLQNSVASHLLHKTSVPTCVTVHRVNGTNKHQPLFATCALHW